MYLPPHLRHTTVTADVSSMSYKSSSKGVHTVMSAVIVFSKDAVDRPLVLVLTHRPTGDLCLPGGTVERLDMGDDRATALREIQEETHRVIEEAVPRWSSGIINREYVGDVLSTDARCTDVCTSLTPIIVDMKTTRLTDDELAMRSSSSTSSSSTSSSSRESWTSSTTVLSTGDSQGGHVTYDHHFTRLTGTKMVHRTQSHDIRLQYHDPFQTASWASSARASGDDKVGEGEMTRVALCVFILHDPICQSVLDKMTTAFHVKLDVNDRSMHERHRRDVGRLGKPSRCPVPRSEREINNMAWIPVETVDSDLTLLKPRATTMFAEGFNKAIPIASRVSNGSAWWPDVIKAWTCHGLGPAVKSAIKQRNSKVPSSSSSSYSC